MQNFEMGWKASKHLLFCLRNCRCRSPSRYCKSTWNYLVTSHSCPVRCPWLRRSKYVFRQRRRIRPWSPGSCIQPSYRRYKRYKSVAPQKTRFKLTVPWYKQLILNLTAFDNLQVPHFSRNSLCNASPRYENFLCTISKELSSYLKKHSFSLGSWVGMALNTFETDNTSQVVP